MSAALRFLTANKHKFTEFQSLFKNTRYEILQSDVQIHEIQTDDMEALVEDKAIKAFGRVRRPIFVDHTGLHLEVLGGFPGGLTGLFWTKLNNDRISELFGNSADPAVTAVTLIGYCDGRSVKVFRGEVKGRISTKPRSPPGKEIFQWDPVFIPEGHDKTFAELGERKNEISMRRKAVDQFIAYLDSAI